MIHIIWHGHSCIEIETDKGSYLVDPYVSENPQADVSVEDLLTKNILGIFLTHGHSDHVGDTLQIYEATKCPIVCEYGVGSYLEAEHNIQAIVGSIGGTVSCGDVKITFFPAIHGNGVVDNANAYKCMPAGLLITIGDRKIYHAGDTALTYDMKQLSEFHHVDIACVPIGDVYTMGIQDAARAVGFIKPDIVFPIHFNTWPSIRVDAIEFARLVMQDTKTVPKVLKPGQHIPLE